MLIFIQIYIEDKLELNTKKKYFTKYATKFCI